MVTKYAYIISLSSGNLKRDSSEIVREQNHNCMHCMSSDVPGICNKTALLRETFHVLVFLPRFSSLASDMQYYCVRYPVEDWNLANVFSSVWLFVALCLTGIYHHILPVRNQNAASGQVHRQTQPPHHDGLTPCSPYVSLIDTGLTGFCL